MDTANEAHSVRTVVSIGNNGYDAAHATVRVSGNGLENTDMSEVTYATNDELNAIVGPMAVIEFDEQLAVVGNGPMIEPISRRVSESLVQIFEHLTRKFDEALNLSIVRYPVKGLPVELTPKERADIATWANHNIPLGNDSFAGKGAKWVVTYLGSNMEFLLEIKPKATRTRK